MQRVTVQGHDRIIIHRQNHLFCCGIENAPFPVALDPDIVFQPGKKQFLLLKGENGGAVLVNQSALAIA